MATAQYNGLSIRYNEILRGTWADERLESAVREELNVGATKVSK